MKIINWSAFANNSSESDALLDFAFFDGPSRDNYISLKEFKKWCYSKETKKEVKKFRNYKVKHLRKLAKRACKRRGWLI